MTKTEDEIDLSPLLRSTTKSILDAVGMRLVEAGPSPALEHFPERNASMTTSPRPLVGICVLVVKQGKILLGKRRGAHGEGEYASPGGHLEHGESFAGCAAREVMEETGITIGPLRFLRVLNCTSYAPKHYIDIAFAAEWKAGAAEVREPDKVERWDWFDPEDLPAPLFAMLPSAIAALLDARDMSLLWEDLAGPPSQRGGNER